jgi:hypothetical protein
MEADYSNSVFHTSLFSRWNNRFSLNLKYATDNESGG